MGIQFLNGIKFVREDTVLIWNVKYPINPRWVYCFSWFHLASGFLKFLLVWWNFLQVTDLWTEVMCPEIQAMTPQDVFLSHQRCKFSTILQNSGISKSISAPSVSVNFIPLVTCCVGLRDVEPQTAHPMSFTWASQACSWDVKLYPTNQSSQLPL